MTADDRATRPYPDVPAKPDYPAMEEAILARWEKEGTFQASIDQRPPAEQGGDEYIFFDGPPFANGLPHYGHILTSYVKDVVPRYQTMKGNRVERRFGWDCHGLPAEMEVEKQTGISGRAAITEFGIDNFNDACRASVMQYTAEWEDYVTRMARWVDFENDYKTMDTSYMESVIWAFKELWDKGLLYEEYRVMPYSWGAQTPLSNFEIRLDDAMRPRQDPALTVLFDLDPREGDTSNLAPSGDGKTVQILAWTTTPWTLPSNLALGVGPEITYAVLQDDEGNRFVIGDAVREKYAKQLDGMEVIGTVTGADLVGRTYRPLFDYFADVDTFPEVAQAFRILGDEFVSTEDGTGVVHMAPAFGEEDQRVSAEHGILIPGMPVDDEGKFNNLVPDYAGQLVFDANPQIAKDLKDRGRVVRHDTYEHNYPHCWRTDTPIIYRALSSWYVKVTDFRDRMVELNQQINWIPDHVQQGAFGNWIAGARDWSISRNRFWGSPIPVWKSDDEAYPRVDVYGSIEELERDFAEVLDGKSITDLHRPFIDELVRPNPDDPTGKSMMRRVPEVLDCWFESGSMPFAQAHYPFENRDTFDKTYPADFIVEYIGQTRGWFYTLHVLATALFDKPAFENVICHGIVLDHAGKKLSKRLRNYPDPVEVFDRLGSDAMRWFLMSSPILRGLDLKIAEDDAQMTEVVRMVLNPIWSAFYFFTLYANSDGIEATGRTDSENLLDRYILAKTAELVEGVTTALDDYELAVACDKVIAFSDALNNWYIRRSRDRFWAPAGGADQADKQAAYDTLHAVLVTLSKVTAPLLPFLAEEIYTTLTDGESVHLADWPSVADLPADPELVAAMDKAREVASAGLSLREAEQLRVRLPLTTLTVAIADPAPLEPYADLIADEVNVRAVEFTTDLAAYGTFTLKPNGKVAGPKLGKAMKDVLAAARAGEWELQDDGSVEVAGHTLVGHEFDLALNAPEGVTATALRANDAIVALDTNVTPELEAEGWARDVVRAIQQQRKDVGLDVADRITLTVAAPDGPVGEAVRTHEGLIAGEVLATSITIGTDGLPADAASVEVGPAQVRFTLAKA